MKQARRIAIVTPIAPYPPDSGTKLRIYHLIRILHAEGFRILLVHYGQDVPKQTNNKIMEWCEEVIHIGEQFTLPLISLPKRVYDRFGRVPFPSRPKLTEELHRILNRWAPDIVQLEKTISAAYLDINQLKASGMRIVLEEGGVHHLYYEREAGAAKSIFSKMLNRRRAMRLKKYEKNIIGAVDAVVAVSLEESELLRKMNPKVHVIYAPNGVDEKLCSEPITPAGQRQWGAFFCGSLNYKPNRDAVDLYLHSVMPLIKKKNKRIDFIIAGGGKQEDLAAVREPLFHPLGYVEDIYWYFKQYALFVNPMRLGGGTNLKMLEAMACGMACVTTTMGAEGIGIESGKQALIAKSMDEMAEHLCRLSDDKIQATLLGEAAREFIATNYTWPKCSKALITYYNS